MSKRDEKRDKQAETNEHVEETVKYIDGVPENPKQDPGAGGYPGQGTPGVGGNPTNEEVQANPEILGFPPDADLTDRSTDEG